MKKEAELVWDDDCEQASQTLKKCLVPPPFLAYPTRDGPFILSMDASDTGMGAVLEQEQEENGRVVKQVIAYASKTLNASQRRYCTTNKELLAVVTAVELFKYYLTGQHFTVVVDYASLTWLCNFWEPEGLVARWITRLHPFNFKIVHRPEKHHSHVDGLSRRTSRPCKRETCPECAPLFCQVTTEEQCKEYFDGYIEEAEDDSDIFRDSAAPKTSVTEKEIAPELLWYLGHHPVSDQQTDTSQGQLAGTGDASPAGNRTESMNAKNLWCQYPYPKMQDGALLRRCTNQGPPGDWQVVAPQTIRTKIFQACHHHKQAAHQGVVRTLTLIKRRFYCPNMHKDVEAWRQRCAVCGKCEAAVREHGQFQQPTYGAFNERVSIDLMGLFKENSE